jgi:hypothetical protein
VVEVYARIRKKYLLFRSAGRKVPAQDVQQQCGPDWFQGQGRSDHFLRFTRWKRYARLKAYFQTLRALPNGPRLQQ